MNFRKVAATVMLTAAATFTAGVFAAGSSKDKQAIEEAVAGSWRSADAKARDHERHPAEALAFWGLKPKMSILEIQPGGGWWTEILAPYARLTKGEFTATAADLDDPGISEGAKKGRADYAAKYSDTAVYGTVNLVNWGSKSAPLPPNKYDFVLLARMIHNWNNGKTADAYYKKIYDGLKPGGVFAVEQHRAPPDQSPDVYNGYVAEKYVIEQIEKAGFKFTGKSEVNANPKDTKDHPFGVWTLPPVRRSAAQGNDPNFDHTKYDAIGESDRMTLRFVKPKS